MEISDLRRRGIRCRAWICPAVTYSTLPFLKVSCLSLESRRLAEAIDGRGHRTPAWLRFTTRQRKLAPTARLKIAQDLEVMPRILTSTFRTLTFKSAIPLTYIRLPTAITHISLSQSYSSSSLCMAVPRGMSRCLPIIDESTR